MRGLERVLGNVPNAIAHRHRALCSVLIVNTT